MQDRTQALVDSSHVHLALTLPNRLLSGFPLVPVILYTQTVSNGRFCGRNPTTRDDKITLSLTFTDLLDGG